MGIQKASEYLFTHFHVFFLTALPLGGEFPQSCSALSTLYSCTENDNCSKYFPEHNFSKTTLQTIVSANPNKMLTLRGHHTGSLKIVLTFPIYTHYPKLFLSQSAISQKMLTTNLKAARVRNSPLPIHLQLYLFLP